MGATPMTTIKYLVIDSTSKTFWRIKRNNNETEKSNQNKKKAIKQNFNNSNTKRFFIKSIFCQNELFMTWSICSKHLFS